MSTIPSSNLKIDLFVNLSLFLVPVFTFFTRVGGLSVLLLSFVIWAIWGRKQTFELNNYQRGFFISCAAVFLVSLLSLIWAGFPAGGGQEIEKYLRLLLVYPFMVLLILGRTKQNWFWVSIAIASILAGAISAVNVYIYDQPRADAFGELSPIYFGNYCILFSYLSFLGFYWFQKKQQQIWSWLSLIGTFSAFIGMTLSGSRASVSSLPILALLIVIYLFLNRKFILIGVFALILSIILTSAILSESTHFKSRLELIPQEIDSYFLEGDRTTSVGLRLYMWDTAWQGFLQKPWLGHGPGNFKNMLLESTQNESDKQAFMQHSHAHNEYLHTLVTKGIVGLVFFLSLLAVPMVAAFSFCAKKESIYGFALIGTIAGFSIFSLTDMTFMRGSGATLFTFLVPTLLVLGFKQSSINMQKKSEHLLPNP